MINSLLKKATVLTLLLFFQSILFAGWEGTYTFQDRANNSVFQYEIVIYELESKITAEFKSKATDESYVYDCKVESLSENKIELIVQKCSKGKGLLKKDDILLGLEKSSSDILTNWGAFSPKSNLESNKPHFKYDKNRIDYMKKYKGQMPYEVEFFRNTWVVEHMQNALKEKYDGLLAFLQVENEISFKENVLYLEATSADKKGIGNAGKNIIAIDIKHNTLFIGLIDGNERLNTYSSGQGPKPKVLTNWINKYS